MAQSKKSTMFKTFLSDESGATAIEYSLIAGGVAVAISVIVFTLGTTLTDLFETVDSAFEATSSG